MTKRLLLALTLAFLASVVCAKDFEKPGLTEIGVVQKVTVNFKGDLDFLRKTLSISPDTLEFGKLYLPSQVKNRRYVTFSAIKYAKDATVENGSFYCVPGKKEKNDILYARNAFYFPLDYTESKIEVGIPASCKVTEKVKYVYTGSWIIDIDPYTYDVSVKYVDEYDQAKQWLKEKLEGKDVELLHGNMTVND